MGTCESEEMKDAPLSERVNRTEGKKVKERVRERESEMIAELYRLLCDNIIRKHQLQAPQIKGWLHMYVREVFFIINMH